MHAISSILLTHLSNRLILNPGSSLSLSCPSSRSLTATVRQYSYLNSIPSPSSLLIPPPPPSPLHNSPSICLQPLSENPLPPSSLRKCGSRPRSKYPLHTSPSQVPP